MPAASCCSGCFVDRGLSAAALEPEDWTFSELEDASRAPTLAARPLFWREAMPGLHTGPSLTLLLLCFAAGGTATTRIR